MKKRQVKLCIACSLDGYIAGPNGEIDWLFDPKDFDMAGFMSSVDTILMGRKTYDFSKSMGPDASMGMKAYVFTRGEPPQDDHVEFVSGDVRAVVEELRSQPGKDLWLMGGGDLNVDFFAERLVDEMIIAVHPIVLGDGIPMWPGKYERIDYELVEARTYNKGLVGLTYRLPAPVASGG